MERLTKRSSATVHRNGVCCTNFGGYACFQRNGNCSLDCPHEEAAWARLADYEDTDLTPEQVVEMQEENVKLSTPDAVRMRKLERVAEKAEHHGGIDHLVALDDAAMQGRLITLPCLPGQTIYRVKRREKAICTYQVAGFLFDGAFWKVRATELVPSWVGNQKTHHYITFSAFGKTVFLTKEAAEAMLGGNNNGKPEN